MCMTEFEGYAEFTDTTFPRSRRLRRCDMCGKLRIRPGDKYMRNVNKYDGELNCVAYCMRCHRAEKALVDEVMTATKGPCSGYYVEPGQLLCCLRERRAEKRAARGEE